ncbi:MAG: porin [Pseudomonadota bacterium]
MVTTTLMTRCLSTVSASLIALSSCGAAQALEKSPYTIALSPSPRIQLDDGSFSVRLAGFLQLDHSDILTTEAQDDDGSTIRRSRIGIRGTLHSHWDYDWMLETGRGGTEIFDANVTYRGFKHVSVRFGQFKEPIGFEWASGAPWWTFMDRALVASISPRRSIGALATTGAKIWRAQVGYYSDNSTIAKSPDENGAWSGRAYLSPVHREGRVLHLGLSASHRTPDPTTKSVRFKAKHETASLSAPTVDTKPIDHVDHSALISTEALAIFGPLSVQGESTYVRIVRDIGEDLNFSSSYVQLSYFLTGEARAYRFKRGAFARVKPKQSASSGAWELAARYGTLDLSDRDITGGSVDRYTVGLNWYPNTHMRFTMNGVLSETGSSGPNPNQTIKSLGLRAQLAF